MLPRKKLQGVCTHELCMLETYMDHYQNIGLFILEIYCCCMQKKKSKKYKILVTNLYEEKKIVRI